MPRKRQGYSGAPNRITQPNLTPNGLPYGERGQLEKAQAAVPLPQMASPAPAPGPVPPVPNAQQGFDQALAQAQATPFSPVNLAAPSQRPAEPVTHGLPIGPGAGPEALGPLPLRVSNTLTELARATGDPTLASMAAAAQARGV